jgi:hypothetical protein
VGNYVVLSVEGTLAQWSLGMILISFLCRIFLTNRKERDAVDLVLRWLGISLLVSWLALISIILLGEEGLSIDNWFEGGVPLAIMSLGTFAGLGLGMWDYRRHRPALRAGTTSVPEDVTRLDGKQDSTYADPSIEAANQLHWGVLGMSISCFVTLVLAVIANIVKGEPTFSQGLSRSSPHWMFLYLILGAIIIAIGCTPLHPAFRRLPVGLRRGMFIAGTVLGVLIAIWP